MSNSLGFKKIILAFFKKPKTSAKKAKTSAKKSSTEFKYHFFWQNWIVFKLLVRLFFNDRVAVFLTLIFPLFISIVYLILYKTNVVTEHLFSYGGIPGVTNIKKWYEFTIYSVGFIAFIYLAVSIADIKHTILFKKIISGFTTKGVLLFLFFIFYLFLTIFALGAKFAIFMFYPSFSNYIVKITQWKYMICALFLFVLTNLSLGLLFSSFKIGSKGVFPITLVVFFLVLFVAGLWIGPSDVESLFFTGGGRASLKYSKISGSAKIWRYLTFVSPLQPGMKTMVSSSSINGFNDLITTTQPKEFYNSNINYFGSEIIKNNLSISPVFSSLDEFKKEIITAEGLQKWISAIKTQQSQLIKSVQIINENTREFADALKEKRVLMSRFSDNYYNFTIIRSGLYNNYLTPFLINFGWILGINGLTLFLWKKTNQF